MLGLVYDSVSEITLQVCRKNFAVQHDLYYYIVTTILNEYFEKHFAWVYTSILAATHNP
jgi:hypothetical protein